MSTLKIAAILAHPTKVDTLQAEIHKLHSTVDSLNKSVHDFGIATTYFHDIINTDVATFIGILGIIVAVIGFLSWRIVKKEVSNVREELTRQLQNQIARMDEFSKTFDEKINSFDKKDIEHSFNNSRLMYTAAYNESQFSLALQWSLNAVLQSFKMTGGEIIGFHTVVWIENVKTILTKDLPKKQLELLIDSINELMADLKKLKNTDIDKVVEEVKAKVYKVIYA